jgi:small subunit ribosomal protein S18
VDFHRETRTRATLARRKRPQTLYGAESRHRDVFRQLDIDPRNEADNRNLMSGYMNGLGRIMNRSQTGLSHRSQRLMGKAIKRSKMMGVIPILSNTGRPVRR